MDTHKKIECIYCNYTRHKCIYCKYTSDRAYDLKRHVGRMHPENKPPQKVEIENHSTVDVVATRNRLIKNSNEFMRKLELGRVIKEIITEDKLMKASLSVEDGEALELFEKHGYVKNLKEH